MREYALVLLVTAAVTYLLTPLVRRVAIATRAIHEPRSRDTHIKPTPLLGGLAMYGRLVAGLLLASRLSFVQDPFRTAGSRSQAGLRAAGRHVHRVPAAQLLQGADLHGRHRRDAARPAARLRPDIQHRFARSGPADQLLAEPHPGPVPDVPAAAGAGRDLHHPVRGPDVRGHPTDPGRQV